MATVSRPRRRLRAALGSLPLIVALLLAMLPAPPPAVRAAESFVSSASAVVPALEPGDENLVQPVLQHPIQDDVFYFVLPDRFSNGNTANDTGDDPGGATEADVLRHGYKKDDKGYFHGGDISGLRSKLPYLESLGVSAIWMTPIFENRPVQGNGTIAGSSAGYHGYWITDFTQVDPHLGANAELQSLVNDAHGRGMKVFFDIITNHTADVIDYQDPGTRAYRNKTNFPYKDANGDEFDDRDYAGTNDFPDLNPDTSFPYKPIFRTPGDATVKEPDWLNNRIYYHNRGDSTFSGESSEYGDFFGLDDLFTEHPDVVDGMIDIYKQWITDYGIDGYRIDTVKHVNIEFWQQFGPQILQHAQSVGKQDFFMYGEVFSGDPAFISQYTTEGQLPSALDFAFQGNATGFAAGSNPTNNLRDFFASDDYYTDANSNAYSLPTFLGNHDIGRFGRFVQTSNAGATDAELIARDRLGHALMFFARGMPVVYYGDEQGFTGDGGDKDARQDMFPSLVPGYNDDDLIGTNKTTADDNFDPSHPLFQAIQQLSALREAHRAFRFGAQIQRYSTDTAGIYTFSRIDRDEKVEFVVALNNAETAQSATFKVFQPNAGFTALSPAGGPPLTSDAQGNITVNVPALGFVVYRANNALPASTAAPSITMSAPTPGSEVRDRFEVAAQLGSDQLAEVTFAVKVGNSAEYTVIGTDNNAPYRVFYDASGHAANTTLTFKAIVNDLAGHLDSTTVSAVVGAEDPGPGGECPDPTYAIIHYQRPGGDYEGWGLHLWGDAIDPSEATEWTSPKAFNGQDEFGRFAFIKLQDASQPVNFIIHKGDEKDTPNDRSFVPAETPEIWVQQGDETNHTSAAAAQGFVRIHYQRPGGDYEGWGLHLWGDAIDPSEATEWSSPKPFAGSDPYGRYADVQLQDASAAVNFIVHKGDEKDTPNDRSFVPADSPTGHIYLMQGDEVVYTSRGTATNTAIIHYHRPAGDYGDYTSTNFNDFWGLHVWTGAANPNPGWSEPIKPVRQDAFGVVFEVPLAEGATTLNYILHRGDAKDQPEDQELDLATFGHEVWIIQETPGYLLPIQSECAPGVPANVGDLTKQKAHWLTRDTIALPDPGTAAANTYRLHFDPSGGITLDEDRRIQGGQSVELEFSGLLSGALLEKHPHLAGYIALKVDLYEGDELGLDIHSILKGQLAVSATGPAGNQLEATGVQIAGVLDDLYTYNGPLGITYAGAVPTVRLWAPTARSVKLHIFNDSTSPTGTVLPMAAGSKGVWSSTGAADWNGKFYLFEVEVFVHSTGKVERNMVTDPYSLSLSMNSTRSQIVNLANPALMPNGWQQLSKPPLAAPEDIVLYELHIRDFSSNDPTVPEQYRGTYKAFTQNNSNGMNHLEQLAQAGLTHIHLLPAFDFATVNENKAERSEPDWTQLASYPPDSEEQARLVMEKAETDAFNWGYDPYHYTAPEGSYSTNPNGPTRIVEFREMVQSLNQTGLRTVMDVVYNHTTASGQGEKSVLDRVVPGYYHRLNLEGAVETSTCCQNTATEHNMMEKLMIDSVLTWATAYKVDGFRFDLMGHHMKRNMVKLRQALNALTMENSGVDGKKIYVYGEGWNFGEVADNARGVNATQLNMPGTGIGTFNDRMRDAVRGGGPFDTGENLMIQGFINGLFYDPNSLPQGGPAAQKERLLLNGDQIRVGLAGNLANYTFVDRNGNTVTGKDVDYNGSPTGYTLDPQETINYIEAHDNQTLFDIVQTKAPRDATMDERVRMHNLGMSILSLTQGIPFFQAGQDMLRSKSLDRNSYNSGDWFNKIDWSYETNNWGVGLPPGENEGNWPVLKPLLADPNLMPDKADILKGVEHFREMLRIRKSSKLFRLQTAQQINERVGFLNTGPNQQTALLVMTINDTVGADLDPTYERIVVVANANDEAQSFTAASFAGASLQIHAIQAGSYDPIVRTSSFDKQSGTFSVPARTTAVFVEHDKEIRLFANLTGEEEVTNEGQPNQGDLDGIGSAVITLHPDRDELCFSLTASNITLPAGAAHIHRGRAGQNGPIVVGLQPPDANGNASGCADASAGLIAEIAADPAAFYVNVHTSDFPKGALRGQLRRYETDEIGTGGSGSFRLYLPMVAIR